MQNIRHREHGGQRKNIYLSQKGCYADAVMSPLTLRPRSPALARFVRALHCHGGELPIAYERILPTGRTELMVNLYEDEFRTYGGPDCATVHRTHGAILAGAFSKATVIDTKEQRCLISVSFKLGGASAFFTTPIGEAQDQLVELDQLWGRNGAVLRERLLEARTPQEKLHIMESILLEHMREQSNPDPVIPIAGSALARGVAVSNVSSHLGLLPKRFTHRFRDQVGLSPKRFSRVLRLQRVLRSASGCKAIDWAELAAEHGYTDQAHLIHDFRALTGLTPAAYQPRSPQEHNHVPVKAAS